MAAFLFDRISNGGIADIFTVFAKVSNDFNSQQRDVVLPYMPFIFSVNYVKIVKFSLQTSRRMVGH